MLLLIKNGLIYSGEEKPPVKGNVLIRDEKIVGAGDITTSTADEVIDAYNGIIAPGFVDINTDSDHYLTLFAEPTQSDFLRQGVTSIVGGNCGSSLAPLLDGSLNSVRKWGDVSKVNIGWRSLDEFFRILGKQGLGVNFGTLVGHSTVRRALIGEDLRDLTEAEMKMFRQVLTKAFQEGALGFSTGLGYSHSRNTPYSEILELVKSAAQNNRVYATHLRSETNGLIAALKETIRIAEESGVNLEITHFRPLKGFEADYEDGIQMIEKQSAKIRINFDLYPFDTSTIAVYMLLPDWAQKGGLEVMLQNVKDPSISDRIKKEFGPLEPENLMVAKVPPAMKFLEGKSLKDFASSQNLEANDALLKLMAVSDLKAVLFHRNINLEAVLKAMTSEHALVSSNGASLPPASLKHERFYNTFPKFLELVQSKNLMSFEKAMAKITSLPALKYKILRRGMISENYYADITVLRDGRVSDVIVNGGIALRDGELKNGKLGKILRYGSEN